MEGYRFSSMRFRPWYWKLAQPVQKNLAPIYDPREKPHAGTVVNGVEIDDRVLPVILACWEMGMKTVNSCEGDVRLFTTQEHTMGLGYISFDNRANAFYLVEALLALELPYPKNISKIATVRKEDGFIYHVEFHPAVLDHSEHIAKAIRTIRSAE